MKKAEQKTDKALKERHGVEPYIFHFRDSLRYYNAITVAVNNINNNQNLKVMTKNIWKVISNAYFYTFKDMNWEPKNDDIITLNSNIRTALKDAYGEDTGIAFCHTQDQFTRRIGRMIAKGKMLKVLDRPIHYLL